MEKSGWNRYGCHSYKYKGRESAAEGQTLVYKFSLFRYLHVWYSSNWYGWNMCCTLSSAQARKSERAIGRFIRDTSTSRAPHWFEIHNFWITILTFFCFEAILKSYIPSVPFLLIWVVDRTFFRHQCGLILVPDWQNHGTSWSNLFNDTFGRVLWITALRFWLLNED